MKSLQGQLSEILEANFIDGLPSPHLYWRFCNGRIFQNDRDIMRGADIDLTIFAIESESSVRDIIGVSRYKFYFPKSFKNLSGFQNEYNNFTCEFEGLKIDITIKWALLDNIETRCSENV